MSEKFDTTQVNGNGSGILDKESLKQQIEEVEDRGGIVSAIASGEIQKTISLQAYFSPSILLSLDK